MYPHSVAFRILASSLSDSCLFVQLVFTSILYLNGMFRLFIIVAAKTKHTQYKVPIFNHPIFTQNRQIISMPKYPDLRCAEAKQCILGFNVPLKCTCVPKIQCTIFIMPLFKSTTLTYRHQISESNFQ